MLSIDSEVSFFFSEVEFFLFDFLFPVWFSLSDALIVDAIVRFVEVVLAELVDPHVAVEL